MAAAVAAGLVLGVALGGDAELGVQGEGGAVVGGAVVVDQGEEGALLGVGGIAAAVVGAAATVATPSVARAGVRPTPPFLLAALIAGVGGLGRGESGESEGAREREQADQQIAAARARIGWRQKAA